MDHWNLPERTRTRHGVHFGGRNDVTVPRFVLLLSALEPQFDHGRTLCTFGLGPGVHDGRKRYRRRIEFTHGNLGELPIHANEPFALLGKIRGRTTPATPIVVRHLDFVVDFDGKDFVVVIKLKRPSFRVRKRIIVVVVMTTIAFHIAFKDREIVFRHGLRQDGR